MSEPVSLIPRTYIPTSSFSGGEGLALIRGKNARLKTVGGRARVENYVGSKDLGEDYDISTDTITGTITFTADDAIVVGAGTLFTTELHKGMRLIADTETFVVARIIDDTHFENARPCTTGGGGKDAVYLWTMQELDKQRLVMRRGSAVRGERKDIWAVGAGLLHLNGTSIGMTATRTLQRFERGTSGAYTARAVGFSAPPPVPVITVAVGGYKGMQAGSFSFMFAYWNSVSDEHSDFTEAVKQDGAAANLTIAASGRFELDFTASLVNMPANADGFVVAGSQSGGGVAATNLANFNNGAWSEVCRIRTTAYALLVADFDTATEEITIKGHKFHDCDSVFFDASFGSIVAGTEYFAIYVSANKIKIASTAANAKARTAFNITAGGNCNARALDANDKTFIEYLDAEMGGVASGDNDSPVEAEFVSEFANRRFLISSLGAATDTNRLGTSPGNYVIPAKEGNPGAFPAKWRVSVGEEITGFAGGVGRLFCLTESSLPFVTPTGRSELAQLLPTGLDMPFTSRPFWTKGSLSPDSLIVIQGDVFVYTGRTILRSPTNADTNVTPFEIGLPVADLTENWFDGFPLARHCPKNQELVIISSATHKNDAGYWVSQLLPYSLQKNEWQPVIELSDDTRDMIVCGAATVGGRLDMLVGGRVASSTETLSTFRYDEAAGVPVQWYIAFQPSDMGEERRQKAIRRLRVTGRSAAAIIQVHGARAGGDIDIDDIEAGTNSLSGNITVPASTGIERQTEIPYLVERLQVASLRYADEWDGVSELNRLDEIVLDVDVHGTAQ